MMRGWAGPRKEIPLPACPAGRPRHTRGMEAPRTTQSVPVTVSVIVDAPTDDDERSVRLQAVADRLHQAAEHICAADPGCTVVGGSSYHYLDDGTENARRCERCGCWATDVDLPDRLDVVQCGSVIGDRFLCEQCRVGLIEPGELPDPITGLRHRPPPSAG